MQTTQQYFREVKTPTQSEVNSYPNDWRHSTWEIRQLWFQKGLISEAELKAFNAELMAFNLRNP